MRLHASIRPPGWATAPLDAALRPEFAQTNQVSWIPPAHWRLHLAGFGNVTQSDAHRLADVFAAHLVDFEAPTLSLSGLVALPEDGDDSVWVSMTGDRDVVAGIAAAVPDWVREFGFMLDRRAFRPRIQLGKITASTTALYLEDLVARLGSFHGDPWTADGVTLGHEEPGSTEREPRFDVLRLVQFGPPDVAPSRAGEPSP
jgi:2'-5' RNA ligase